MNAANENNACKDATKRCAWCSRQEKKDVFHQISNFGAHPGTRDGLRPSCKMSMRTRERIARNGTSMTRWQVRERLKREKERLEMEKERKKALEAERRKGGIFSREWFRAFHKYGNDYLENDAIDMQLLFLQNWKRTNDTEKETAKRIAGRRIADAAYSRGKAS